MLGLYIGITVAGVVIILYILVHNIYISIVTRNTQSSEYLRI